MHPKASAFPVGQRAPYLACLGNHARPSVAVPLVARGRSKLEGPPLKPFSRFRSAIPELTPQELAFIEGYAASTALLNAHDLEAENLKYLVQKFAGSRSEELLADYESFRSSIYNSSKIVLLIDEPTNDLGDITSRYRNWVKGFNQASSMNSDFWEDVYMAVDASALMYPIVAFTYDDFERSALEASDEEIESVQRELVGDMSAVVMGLRQFLHEDDEQFDTLH